MNKFWTIEYPHSRERFARLEDAVKCASKRIETGKSEVICIMECVKVVKRASLPAVVEDVTTPFSPIEDAPEFAQ